MDQPTRAGRWAVAVLPPERLPATAREADALEAAVGFERAAPPSRAARGLAPRPRRVAGSAAAAAESRADGVPRC